MTLTCPAIRFTIFRIFCFDRIDLHIIKSLLIENGFQFQVYFLIKILEKHPARQTPDAFRTQEIRLACWCKNEN
jgi:hypothetical protein